ncbi:TonB-dependent receptor family protein [Phenylobacterium sp.]|jgi:iron complex outermembrane receptor protein|uniref:TonB-dependent receptor family protein n=1 Tax=Phenylobacterium sp. TaxID=1871053 RepID=UPI002F9360E4
MRSLLLLSAATCAALAAAPAAAADAPTVETIIVTGSRDPEDPPAVAAARERLSQTPGAVSVISREAYERRFAVALDDTLRDVPGVYAQKKWGGDIRLSIRGSGLGNANHNRGLLIAEDGVPLNEADGFGDSQVADPLNTRLTEVYRGGNALRFGGASLGGAINMVTPTGRDAGFDARLRLDGGSFGMAREHLAAARELGDWDIYAAATNQTGQGWRPQSQQNLQFGTLNVGRNFGEEREVRFILNGSNISQEIPGALTPAQFVANSRQAAPANYANDQGRHQRGLRASLRGTWRVDESLLLEGAVYGVWKDLDHPIFQVIDQQSRNWGAFGRASWDGSLFGRRADLFAGAWLRSGDLDSNFYVNVRGARGAPTSRTLQNAQAADVFAEGRLFVTERLAVIAGGTSGWASRDYRSFAVPGAPATFELTASKDYSWFAPRIGLLWEGEDGMQLFANVTRAVEPPNLGSMSPTNAGFAPVEAQEAVTAEVGTRGRRGPFLWDLAVYRAVLDGELLQYTVTAGVPAPTFNAGRTIHQGVEAALDWQPLRSLRLRQTWTLSDFRFEGERQYGDNRLPIAPRSFYRAELRYEHSRGWWIAPAVERASSAWADYRNTVKVKSYAIWSLGAGAALGPRTALFLDVRNITDEAYVSNVQAQILASPGVGAYWPGDGRSIFGGVTWTF